MGNPRPVLTPLIVIDEAHLLSPAMLEEIRFLTNFHMDSASPMALCLVGQPERRNKLRLRAFEAMLPPRRTARGRDQGLHRQRWRGVLVGGVLWAAAGIWFRLAVGETLSMASYSHAPVYSEFIDLMKADWVGLGKLFWPPIALGSDILAWTVGTAVWLFHPVGWPGAALGHLLLPHPSLDMAVVILGSVIGGVVLCVGISLLARLFGRLPSRPR